MEGCKLLGGVEWGVAVKRDGQSGWIGGMAARVGVFREFLKTFANFNFIKQQLLKLMFPFLILYVYQRLMRISLSCN